MYASGLQNVGFKLLGWNASLHIIGSARPPNRVIPVPSWNQGILLHRCVIFDHRRSLVALNFISACNSPAEAWTKVPKSTNIIKHGIKQILPSRCHALNPRSGRVLPMDCRNRLLVGVTTREPACNLLFQEFTKLIISFGERGQTIENLLLSLCVPFARGICFWWRENGPMIKTLIRGRRESKYSVFDVAEMMFPVIDTRLTLVCTEQSSPLADG